MKSAKTFIFISVLLMLTACSSNTVSNDVTEASETSSGKIYLFGEQHAVKKILDKELELWQEYYNSENMRHLFIEYPYYTAEFLNIWMQSDNDDILDDIYNDWVGTSEHNQDVKEFYKNIKNNCPETIFHGTDVGHQYDTTGEKFLNYLEDNKLKYSEKYTLTQEVIEQGEYFQKNSDYEYRENTMTENFIREFDNLENENVMGIYGSAHTDFNAMGYKSNSVPSMANQLKKYYNDNIYSENLSFLAKDIEPLKIDTLIINEKEYEALYFGKQDLNGFKDYTHREFWRLENAYNDFKDYPKIGDSLPYDNYPMLIETKQVFVIDYTKTDNSVTRKYYRSDGNEFQGLPSTDGILVKNEN